MADINAYLREAINGPAPQHKVAGRNQFEISEGSDGATHTKIVDVDGNPLSFVPVEDEAVKAELAEIRRTQAQILERLDGGIDARLTGSNVEYAQGYYETLSFTRSGALAAGASETIADINGPCELESLMIGTDDKTVLLRVENKKSDGQAESGMRIVDVRGRYSNPISPSTLHQIGGENDYWSVFKFDEDNKAYAFGMKRNSMFGAGLRIRITNGNGSDCNFAITCIITKYHTIGG